MEDHDCFQLFHYYFLTLMVMVMCIRCMLNYNLVMSILLFSVIGLNILRTEKAITGVEELIMTSFEECSICHMIKRVDEGALLLVN